MTLPQLQEQQTEQGKPYARSASPLIAPPAKRVRVKEEPTEGSEQLKPRARSASPSTTEPPAKRVATGIAEQKEAAVANTVFFDLPQNVRSEIFGFFSFQENLKRATVSKEFKESIYEYCNVAYGTGNREKHINTLKSLHKKFTEAELPEHAFKYLELFPDYATEDELLLLMLARPEKYEEKINPVNGAVSLKLPEQTAVLLQLICESSSIVVIETQTGDKDFLKNVLCVNNEDALRELLKQAASRILARLHPGIEINDLCKIGISQLFQINGVILLLQMGCVNLQLWRSTGQSGFLMALQFAGVFLKLQKAGLFETFEEFAKFMYSQVGQPQCDKYAVPTLARRLMELQSKRIICTANDLYRMANNLQDDYKRLLCDPQTEIVISELGRAGVIKTLRYDFTWFGKYHCCRPYNPLLPLFQELLNKRLIDSYNDLLKIPHLPAVCYSILCHLNTIVLLQQLRFINTLKDIPDVVYADNGKILHLLSNIDLRGFIEQYQRDGIINNLSDIVGRNFEVLNIILGNYKRIMDFIRNINFCFNCLGNTGFLQLSDVVITWLFDKKHDNDRRVVAYFQKYKMDHHGVMPSNDSFAYLNQLGVAGIEGLLSQDKNLAPSKPRVSPPRPSMR